MTAPSRLAGEVGHHGAGDRRAVDPAEVDIIVELGGHDHGFEIVHAGNGNGRERRLRVGEIRLGLHQGRPRCRDERFPVGIEALQVSAPAALAGRHAVLGLPLFRNGLCPGIDFLGVDQTHEGIGEHVRRGVHALACGKAIGGSR
jgi:hypothetical protein